MCNDRVLDQDKYIIIVGAGLLLVPTIKIAKQMGLKVIATDWSKDAPGFRYADVPMLVSTKDVERSVQVAKELAQKYNIAGVFTAGADVEMTVANIAHALGLPGISPIVAYICNNKVEMRKCLEKAGIAGPWFTEVSSINDVKEFVKSVKFPVIVKAVDNCGSRGIRKVYNPDELEETIVYAKNFSSTGSAMIEEYLEGPKQTVEMLVYNDTYHLCSIIDTHYAYDPYPVETSHNNPSRLPKNIQQELYVYAEKVARAVGINIGAAKVDTVLTKDGPKVIELTARLSGGFHCQYTSPLAFGTNDIKAAIDIAIGNPLDLSDITPKMNRVSICQAIFPEPGKVISVNGIEEAKKIRGIEEVFVLVKEGDVIEPYRSSAGRVCFMIAVGADFNEAENILERAANTIEIKTA